MAEYMSVPDGWREVTYDVTEDDFDANWVYEDAKVMVTATVSQDADGSVTFPVVVEQRIEKDGLETDIQSHALIADTRKEAERMAAEFMHEVNEGHHVLRVMGVEEWKEFYQFYCVSDSEIPGELTADELIAAIDNEEYDDSIDDLPNDFEPDLDAEHTVTVDVFPRHKAELETDDDD